jgi:oligosaccharide repeat unit polymerase
LADLLIIVLAAFATAVPLWLGRQYGLAPLVSPMHFLGYFCAAGFLIKVSVYSQKPEWAFYRRFIETPGADMGGALYLTGFVLLMALGYRCAIRSTDNCEGLSERRMVAAGIQRTQPLFVAAFVIAAVTLVLILRARGISGLSPDVLETLNRDKQVNVNAAGNGATLAGIKSLFIVPKCAFVLLFAAGLVRQSKFLLIQTALIAALLICVALVTGDRFELLELFAYGAITYLLVGGIVRLRSVLVAGGAALAVLLASAYMTPLRGSDAGLLHQIVGSTYFLDINASVMISDRMTPALYLQGESYTWWGFGWFPRAYWPDKPAIDLGVYFKRVVMALPEGGAFNVTGPGEAFINFGWGGMAVGFALGWLYRRVEVGILAAPATLRFASFVYFPLLFYPFIQATLQSSFSAFLVGAAAQGILIVGIVVTCVPRYREKPMLGGVRYAG